MASSEKGPRAMVASGARLCSRARTRKSMAPSPLLPTATLRVRRFLDGRQQVRAVQFLPTLRWACPAARTSSDWSTPFRLAHLPLLHLPLPSSSSSASSPLLPPPPSSGTVPSTPPTPRAIPGPPAQTRNSARGAAGRCCSWRTRAPSACWSARCSPASGARRSR